MIELLVNRDGLIVNRIVTNDDTPTDIGADRGLTRVAATSEIVQETVDEIIVDITIEYEIGGTYVNGVYTPPENSGPV